MGSTIRGPASNGLPAVPRLGSDFDETETDGPVRCELSVDGRWCQISVSDLGLGISEADLPKVFTRFGRILTLENQGISGTGLGLYMSRELARQQGGDIEVVSRLGAGSTFTLSLPVA